MTASYGCGRLAGTLSAVCMASVLLAAACALVAAPGAAAAAQTQVRTIPHVRGVSIADRLEPDDRVVRVVRVTMPPGVVVLPRPLSWEENVERLKRLGVVLARHVRTEGRLTDDGAWIRTHTVAQVTRVVIPGPIPVSGHADSIGCSFDGGEASVSGVRVIAGEYPILAEEKEYLLFLYVPEGATAYTLSLAMEVDAAGRLAMVFLSDGTPMDLPSLTYGQPAERLIRDLSRQ